MPAALTLGPILYHWSAEEKRDFYARIADEALVNTVYVGEVICSKRAPFFEHELPATIERLQRGGKQVVLSSLAEVILKRERAMTAALFEAQDHEVEINNNAGLYHAGGKPHRIGPLLNVYNDRTLRFLAAKGATHFTLPTELPRQAVRLLTAAATDVGAGIEVQVFGRASLALSAHCYHARAYGRTRDNCQFVCETHPDGMPLKTLAGQDFLAINGIQTLSQSYLNLADRIEELQEFGVGHFRLMPQRVDMVAVANIFAARIHGSIGAGEAEAKLLALKLPAPFANGFWHGVAGERRVMP